MTARFLPWICLFGCTPAEPATPAARAPDLVVPPMPDAGPPPAPLVKAPAAGLELSYEEALAMPPDAGSIVAGEADLTDAELSAPTRHAAFIAGCGAPNAMKVTVKVAVQGGRAVGVTVRTNPDDERVARCVDEHVRRELRWPARTKMDSFTVTY